jgi:hypothetical protein
MVRVRKPGLVQIGRPAIDPVADVVPVAPLRWVITARKGTSAVPGSQCHGLTPGGDPAGSPTCEGDIVAVHECGPDFDLISDPQQLIGAELAAVSGFSDPSLGKQIVDIDCDDD